MIKSLTLLLLVFVAANIECKPGGVRETISGAINKARDNFCTTGKNTLIINMSNSHSVQVVVSFGTHVPSPGNTATTP